jgi:hypothetical protein
MQPLPRPPERYSASPLPSWATARPNVVPRYVSFSETLQAIWQHLSGRPRPSMRERWLAEKAIDRLAEEMAAETEMDEAAETINPRKTPESHSLTNLTGGGG